MGMWIREGKKGKGEQEWSWIMQPVSDRPSSGGGRVRSDGEMDRRRVKGWKRNLGRRSAAASGGSRNEEGKKGERQEAGNQLSRQNVEYVWRG